MQWRRDDFLSKTRLLVVVDKLLIAWWFSYFLSQSWWAEWTKYNISFVRLLVFFFWNKGIWFRFVIKLKTTDPEVLGVFSWRIYNKVLRLILTLNFRERCIARIMVADRVINTLLRNQLHDPIQGRSVGWGSDSSGQGGLDPNCKTICCKFLQARLELRCK